LNIQQSCEILEQMLADDIDKSRLSTKESTALNVLLFEIALTGQYVLPEKFILKDMYDKPLNGGYICSKHGVGYKGKCPTCASIENPPRKIKRQGKLIRQTIRKSNRKR